MISATPRPTASRPFPSLSASETNPTLEAAGRAYYEFRAALMVANNEGLTKTYNRFHDPDERADGHRAAARAARRDGPRRARRLRLERPRRRAPKPVPRRENEDDHTYQGRFFWPSDFRDEVLARLLALNAERHAEEVRLGIDPRAKGRAAASEEEALEDA